jgi:putative ribosome biogenesis GTPase RsgA
MQYESSGFGRVLAQHRGRWLVATDDEEKPRLLPARGSLRDTPPVTGDWVELDPGGAISAVLERRCTLVRRAAGDATAAEVLAATWTWRWWSSRCPIRTNAVPSGCRRSPWPAGCRFADCRHDTEPGCAGPRRRGPGAAHRVAEAGARTGPAGGP